MNWRQIICVVFFLLCNKIFAQNPNPVVLISGKVLNERNMKPLEAKVVYEFLPDGSQAGTARTDPSTGAYKIILPFGKNYGYMALAEGYYSVTKNLDVTTLNKYTEIDEQNLFLAPVEVDQVVRLNNIFFEGMTSKIKAESFPELNRFAAFLKINKKIEVEISGHTDNQGKPDDLLNLSISRAQAVSDYLAENKIDGKRFTIVGYGDTQPMGFNKSEDGREMNRRIEFKITSLTRTKKK